MTALAQVVPAPLGRKTVGPGILTGYLVFTPEWRNFVWRFLAFTPGVLVMTLIYLRIRRLGPVILAHWAMDIIATFMTMR